MWNKRFRKYFYVLFIIVLNSCSVFHSTRNETEDYDHFPKNILYTFNQGSNPPFRDGALDSLVKFADTLQGYPRFKSRVEQIVMERKYVDDFTRAYDGDLSAWMRLEQACGSENLEEANFVVWTLGKMDRLRVIKRLEQVLREDHGYCRYEFQNMLKHQKYLYDNEHQHPSVSESQKQIDSISNLEIETVLSKGSRFDFKAIYNDKASFAHMSAVLSAAMERTNADYYHRGRELMISIVDSLEKVDESLAQLYVDNLLLPAPGDTVDDSTQVKEIFNDILKHCIYKKEYFNEYVGNGTSNRRAYFDTMKFSHVVVVAPKYAYLPDLAQNGTQIIAATHTELVREANRNGIKQYNTFRITTYDDFASVAIGSIFISPIWHDMLLGGGSRWYTLRKVNGRWTIIGSPGSIVS